MIVTREMTFRAKHSHHGMLIEPLHGHDYTFAISVRSEPNEEGFVVDFRAVKRLFKRLVTDELEGKDLDSLFEYPTAENLAQWVWHRLSPFFDLYRVEVREKPHSSVIYEGPNG